MYNKFVSGINITYYFERSFDLVSQQQDACNLVLWAQSGVSFTKHVAISYGVCNSYICRQICNI